MPEEVAAYLEPAKAGVIIDSTLGLGGHAELLLSSFPEVELIGAANNALAISWGQLAHLCFYW